MKNQELACTNKDLWRFGPFILDIQERRLLRDGEAVPLIRKLFDLLVVLVECAGRLKTREELMAALWPNVTVEEQSLTAKVYALRKKLGDEGAVPLYIETIRGIGYRFIAPVSIEGTVVGKAHPTTAQTARPRLRFAAGVSTVTLLAALSAGIVYQVLLPQPHQHASPAYPTVAVQPFESLGADKTNSFLAAGIENTILTRLAEIGGIRVIAHPSGAHRSRSPGLRETGFKLPPTAVLMGTVQRTDKQVLINVQLVDARSRVQLWAASYIRTVNDAIDVENEVAGKVAAALDQEVGAGNWTGQTY